jgi:hypothetical protein
MQGMRQPGSHLVRRREPSRTGENPSLACGAIASSRSTNNAPGAGSERGPALTPRALERNGMRWNRVRFHLIPSRALEIVVPQGMMGSADSSRTHHALDLDPAAELDRAVGGEA